MSNYFNYRLPHKIDSKIDPNFYQTFYHSLCKVFGDNLLEVQPTGERQLFYIQSTGGWATALEEACIQCSMEWFFEYWTGLSWIDSDMLDGLLSERIVEKIEGTEV